MTHIDRERFTGFADLYDAARPRPPEKAVRILLDYLQVKKAETVVDLGSGTGLSTVIWKDHAASVVGIEPTPDMREQAVKRHPELAFRDGTSYATGLPAAYADIVACSQAFHWMEPVSTIAEMTRILRPGGLFAVYDCAWPVSWAWEAERAHEELFASLREIEAAHPELNKNDRQYPKSRHLENFRASGAFRYARELYFENNEPCDAERFIGIALSQGHLQKLLKAGIPEAADLVKRFKSVVRSCRGTAMRVSYTMVLGIK